MTSVNRRVFAFRMLAIAGFMPFSGCWPSNIYKDIERYIPTALLAFGRIVDILLANGIETAGLTAAINKVKAALADIQTAIEQFREHDKPTLVAAVLTALKIASERLIEFWNMLNIPNAQLAAAIKRLLDVIISTLQAFISRLQPNGPTPAHSFLAAPKPPSVKEFREEFNIVLRASGYSKYEI